MLKSLALGAEAARRAVHTLAKVPGADTALARAIVFTGRAVPSAAEADFTGEDRPLRRLHSQAASLVFEANGSGAQRLLQRLDISTIKDADYLERLAARYHRIHRYDAALAMRQRAAQLDSENPVRHLALGRALQRASSSGLMRDPIAGLTTGPQPRTEEARQALHRAAELAPENPAILHELGRLEFDHGDLDRGLELLEQAVSQRPNAVWHVDAAKRFRKPHVLQLEKALEHYEKALALDPGQDQTFRHVITIGCRAVSDWPRLWRSAELYEGHRSRRAKAHIKSQRRAAMDQLAPLFTTELAAGGAISAAEARSAVQTLQQAEAAGHRLSWPTTLLISYRLQFAGHLGLGFEIRQRLAERSLAWLGTTSGGHIGHRQKLLAALVYLDRLEEAQRLIDPAPWPPQTDLAAQQLQKLAADVQLTRGNHRPYLEYSAQQRARIPLPVDDTMESLVRGKRVAIVGPVDTGDQLGELIDGHDVVVRPRFALDFVAQHTKSQGSRTDIVYINGQDIDPLLPQLDAAVESGNLQLAVARPISLQQHLDRQLPWLRFYRQDYALNFHGAPLGVQRFIYDILQFEPAEIAVFNSDMYTGLDPFAAGYREAKDTSYGPGSIMNDLIVLHDLLFDFKYLQGLQATGIITLHGRSAEVGALTPEEYVHAIETGGALR
ncbi:tetratricopeptide repeat protein [Nesterenkonia massiliensis]|uniref:tetratricopeptide repeat protein n=1 Tax=Nesterenkonia massiliensis TaxID=1232429 RepID=UPI0003F99F89|nr:tetratricopeptide repeat protein [Nesterenkonia massiliensis]